MSGKVWASADIRRACDLRTAGWTNAAIGNELGRSDVAVERALLRAGYPPQVIVHRWTAEDQQRAIELRRAGKTNAYIGEVLGRSARALITMFYDLRKSGVPIPMASNQRAAGTAVQAVRREAKAAQPKRKCLRCGDMFPSWGPGNRRCDGCSSSVAATGMSAWL